MLFRRSTTVKYSLAAFFGAALYCEWVVYLVQPNYWVDLKCKEYDSGCTKVLFVADPQIQGDLAVAPPLNYLFNWDSDRYLKSTFNVAMKHFKPDVVVYLGDLMDEGSISSMEQFHSYVKRLFDIFDVDYSITQVWLPGDNDIGGENEPIRQDKVHEFEVVFQQPSVITYKNVSFYKVNGITHSYPKKDEMQEGDEDRLRIAVSHYPVTAMRTFATQIRDQINPNVFICAHEHESKYVRQNQDFRDREVHRLESPKNVLKVPFNDEMMYEIFVPASSYRMGTSYIGFGAAVIENNNSQLRYTVFWSPTRFPCLILYAVMLFLFTLYCMVFCAARLFHRKSVTKTADLSPLLEKV